MSNDATTKDLVRELQAMFPGHVQEYLGVPAVKAAYDALKLRCDEFYLRASEPEAEHKAGLELAKLKMELTELSEVLSRAVADAQSRREGGISHPNPKPLTFNLADSLAALGKSDAALGSAAEDSDGKRTEKTVEVDLGKKVGAPKAPKAVPGTARAPRISVGNFLGSARFLSPQTAMAFSVASMALTLTMGGMVFTRRNTPPKVETATFNWNLIDKRIREITANYTAREVQSQDTRSAEQLKELAERQVKFEREVASRLQKLETAPTKRSETATTKLTDKKKKRKH